MGEAQGADLLMALVVQVVLRLMDSGRRVGSSWLLRMSLRSWLGRWIEVVLELERDVELRKGCKYIE